jgi:hypothetical protein
VPRSPDKFVVFNLRETYHELGEFEFKIVLNPRNFKNSHLSDLVVTDSSGQSMKYSIKKWGRKINCSFVIDQNSAEGRSHVKLSLRDSKEQLVEGHLMFWVIKP